MLSRSRIETVVVVILIIGVGYALNIALETQHTKTHNPPALQDSIGKKLTDISDSLDKINERITTLDKLAATEADRQKRNDSKIDSIVTKLEEISKKITNTNPEENKKLTTELACLNKQFAEMLKWVRGGGE